MGIDLNSFNDKQRGLIDSADRKPLGRAGMTAAECRDEQRLRLEREDQRQFRGWLERNEYAYYHSGTHKRSSANLGVPDFIIGCGVGLAIEFKRWGAKLRPEQEEWRRRYEARGGRYYVVTDYQSAIEITERYG
jgi:hypothetical protein